MKRLLTVCLALLCLGPAARLTRAQALAPASFAYGMPVDTTGASPVQRFLLPDTVYHILTRPDLGDLRVFNQDGEPLAHAIDRARPMPEAPPDRVALPFFPIYGRSGDSAVSVEVQRTASGTLVRVGEAPGEGGAAPATYVVDASALDRPVNALTISWEESRLDVLAERIVETSDDLNRWSAWGAPATLAELRRQGSVLTRDDVSLPVRQATYYRLRVIGETPPLTRVVATLASTGPRAEHHWLSLSAARVDQGVFEASHNGVFTVDRIRVTFERPNTLARIRIESAANPDGPWRRHYAGTAYRIEVDGRTLETEDILIRGVQHRYWRVIAGQGAEMDPSLTPILELGWVPAEVLFLARGTPPYTLAFGSASVEPAAFAPDDLLQLTAFEPTAPAQVGPIAALGGSDRLRAPLAVNWKTVVLWGSLILGVVVMGLLALNLMRQTRAE